ncbi:MAG TPA: ABC transporter permease [Clostridiales bacterium]|nr:ABC transporter permease [Clostridiales bacterium]
MKFSYYNYLARVNIRRSKKSGVVFYLMLFSAICLIVIGSFSSVVMTSMDAAKTEDQARRFYIYSSSDVPLREELLTTISQLPHVESVDKQNGLGYVFCNGIIHISEEEESPRSLELRTLFASEKKKVIAGETLDSTPTFSCLLPRYFSPYREKPADEDTVIESNDNEYEDGRNYIGKTIDMTTYDELPVTAYGDDDSYLFDMVKLGQTNFQLKVVGVYENNMTTSGGSRRVWVSDDTSNAILQKALDAADDGDRSKKLLEANAKDTSKTFYTVLADNYSNVNSIYKELDNLQVNYDVECVFYLGTSTLLMGSIFSGAGTFLTFSIILLMIINMFLAVSGNMLERKNEMGLLKAVGYTNKNIFFAMLAEQLRNSLKAYLIGTAISGVLVLGVDFYLNNAEYIMRSYVIQPQMFIMFALIALAIAVIVPVLCLLIMVGHITKTEPKNAMEG